MSKIKELLGLDRPVDKNKRKFLGLLITLPAGVVVAACAKEGGIIDQISGAIPEGVHTPTPGSTATATAFPTETLEAIPTNTATPEAIPTNTLTPEPTRTAIPTETMVENGESLSVIIEPNKAFSLIDWEVTIAGSAFADRGDGTTFIQDFYPQLEKFQGLEKKMEFWRFFPNGFTERELRAYKLFGYNYEIVSEDGKLFLKLGDQKAEIVDHGDGEYGFPDGAEFGMHEHQFCGAGNEKDSCNFTVGAGHYVLITGDGRIPELKWNSSSMNGEGSALLIINVGTVSSDFGSDSSVILDNVYFQSGRCYNGEQLPIEQIMAHTNNNMLNQDTRLNVEEWINAGANCSSLKGCGSVNNTVIIVSGNEVLARFETVMSK